jgi:hypothetical protein
MGRSVRSMSLLVPLLVGAGCGAASSPYMRASEPPQPLRAAADSALVVFVRPSGFAYGVGANILDENGRFLGDAMAQSHFAVVMPPGRHMFAVWAENTDAVGAELAPGRVYYVEVMPTMGAFSAQMHLRAIKPSLPSWQHLQEWLTRSKQLIADMAAGQSNLDRRPQDVAERMRRARERLSRYSGEALVEHTLAPDDGAGG